MKQHALILFFLFLGFMSLAFLSTGCTSTKPQKLFLTIHPTKNINPNEEGESSPLVMSFYQLNKTDNFNNNDFFALYNHPENLLKNNFIDKKELIIFPGQQKNIELPLNPKTENIGIVAAFRDLTHAEWEKTFSLNNLDRAEVKIDVDQNNINISK
jgi:type VI secretion system protein VasD